MKINRRTAASYVRSSAYVQAAGRARLRAAVTGAVVMPSVFGLGPYFQGSGPISPALPTGVQPGMLLVMPVETNSGEAPAVGGWTAAPDSPVDNASGTRLSIFWRRATGSGDTPTITDSGDHQSARVIAFNGVVGTGDPWDVTASATGSGTAISITGDTTTGSDRLVVAFASHSVDKTSEHFSGWTNADLDNVTEQFDNSTAVGNGGGIACATGEKAAAGTFTTTDATGTETAAWAGWVGALLPGPPISEGGGGGGSPEEPDTPEEGDDESGLNIDTWEFDSLEPDVEDRTPINWYVAYQLGDQSLEQMDKLISAIRLTGKGAGIEVQIHAASPGEEIDRSEIEDGTNPRATTVFPDTTVVTRYSRKKVRIKNLSIWTVRISGTDSGEDEVRDRIDELIIEGRSQGVKK